MVHSLASATIFTPSSSDSAWSMSVAARLYSGEHISDVDIPSQLHKKLQVQEALDIIHQRGTHISPSNAYNLLQDCAKRKDLDFGIQVQLLLMQNGLDTVSILADYLIRLFASCKSLDEAKQTFNKVVQSTVYTWSAIISAHCNLGHPDAALELYYRIKLLGLKPGNYIYPQVLKACTLTLDVDQGRIIHEHIIEIGLEADIFVANTLVDMYAKCGNLIEARAVFENLSNPDIVSWNAMIIGYAEKGEGVAALDCFYKMQDVSCKPNKVTFLGIFKACSNNAEVEQGRIIHEQIIQTDLQHDVFIGSALIDMYGKCGSLDEAYEVFDKLSCQTVVSWGAMISVFAQHGEGLLALKYFDTMQHEGIKPDIVSFSSILKACKISKDIEQGKGIHKQITESGLQMDTIVGNSLVDMYARCGRLEKAREIFESLSIRDMVSWCALIARYVEHDENVLALQVYDNMQYEGIRPDKVTFLAILKACGSTGAMEHGTEVHKKIIESGLLDLVIGNTLIDMYGKCGSLKNAHNVFNQMPNKDVVSWNALIAGYSQVGDISFVIQCFEDMYSSDIKPDSVTFIGILVACSRAGLVDEGYLYYRSMMECHRIMPTIVHHNCMTELIGRAGFFDEAQNVLQVDLKPNVCGWKALLSACKMHHNVELAERCLKEIVHIDCNCAAGYILMSSIYADALMLRITIGKK